MCTCSEGMTRRDTLRALAGAAAAMAAAGFPPGRARAARAGGKPKRVLFFTKSGQFEHTCIRRPDNHADDRLSHAEQVLVDLGKQHGFEVVATKDGRVFTPEGLRGFDAVAFYTQGDITVPGVDGTPPIAEAGKAALLEFVKGGKGFVGFHCASGTFPSAGGAPPDDYTKMLGAEATWHGAQQRARLRAVGGGFAPLDGLADFDLHEEWYVFKHVAPDLHVILVQETAGMIEDAYRSRRPYPQTWARRHGEGRVFYTSLGHREDVWTNPLFQKIVLGGMSWALGDAEANAEPNLKQACPDAENVRVD
jgi:type 1 glutamine amidotransferase